MGASDSEISLYMKLLTKIYKVIIGKEKSWSRDMLQFLCRDKLRGCIIQFVFQGSVLPENGIT